MKSEPLNQIAALGSVDRVQGLPFATAITAKVGAHQADPLGRGGSRRLRPELFDRIFDEYSRMQPIFLLTIG